MDSYWVTNIKHMTKINIDETVICKDKVSDKPAC